MATRTRWWVSSETGPVPLTTRDTVAVETPAWAAMSVMRVRCFAIEGPLLRLGADPADPKVTVSYRFRNPLQKQMSGVYSSSARVAGTTKTRGDPTQQELRCEEA